MPQCPVQEYLIRFSFRAVRRKHGQNNLIRAIGTKFGFALPKEGSDELHELKRADLQLLVDEKAVIMAEEPEPWPLNAPGIKNTARIECWPFELAKDKFVSRFAELS